MPFSVPAPAGLPSKVRSSARVCTSPHPSAPPPCSLCVPNAVVRCKADVKNYVAGELADLRNKIGLHFKRPCEDVRCSRLGTCMHAFLLVCGSALRLCLGLCLAALPWALPRESPSRLRLCPITLTDRPASSAARPASPTPLPHCLQGYCTHTELQRSIWWSIFGDSHGLGVRKPPVSALRVVSASLRRALCTCPCLGRRLNRRNTASWRQSRRAISSRSEVGRRPVASRGLKIPPGRGPTPPRPPPPQQQKV